MKVENGSKVKVHYIGTLNDGVEFDNSYKRGNTLDFEVGQGQMIKGFEDSVMGMEQGDKKSVTIAPENAYGTRMDEAITEVDKANFPPDFVVEIGAMVQGQTEQGMPIQAKILEEKENSIVLDLNHPLAGKELNFEIELVELN